MRHPTNSPTADFRSQLNAARTTRQRSARVVVGSVLVPRGLVCLVRSIIHVCTCTIQPTLHKRLAPLSCWVMACYSMSKGLQFTLEALAFSRSRTVVLRFPASLTWQQV